MAKVAVAMSGGGYRASAWGLGVLWCLADTGLNADVTMVSSVSGGSITNAVAGLGTPYRSATPEAFDHDARRFLTRLAGRAPAFKAALLGTLLAAAVGWFFAGHHAGTAVAVAAAAMVLVGILGAATAGDLLFNRVEIWLYVDLLLASVGVLVWAWPNPLLVAACVLGLSIAALFRGPVVGWSIGRSLRTLTQRPDQTLGGLNPEPLHVFLATELRAGHHAAFARGFVYCFDLGVGAKPSLPVRVAVQASANLPGAFPTRWVSTRGMALEGGQHQVAWLALSDGGVYDNMADQWPVGLPRRIERLERLDPARAVVDDWKARQADFVIVANASGALGFRRVRKGALPLLGELLGLLQVKDVLYDNGNSVRRTQLVDWFDAGKPAGTLVHVASNPYVLPQAVARRLETRPDPDLAARVQAAFDYLAATGLTKDQWAQRVAAAAEVGTQLWPLGRAKANEVVITAYVQTMVNLHLKCGTALHPPPAL